METLGRGEDRHAKTEGRMIEEAGTTCDGKEFGVL